MLGVVTHATTEHATTELLTAEELAERLRVRPSTIRLWAREGLIPVVKIGAKVLRFDVADVLAALKGREYGVSDAAAREALVSRAARGPQDGVP